jgi:hypothetical protein
MKPFLKYKQDNQQIEIDLCKSAPIQIKPLTIIDELIKYWKKKGYREIIDVGCGKLRNSLVLVNHFSLWICDFPEQLNNPNIKDRLAKLKKSQNLKGIIYPNDLRKGKLNADAAFICFVIHTIPEKRLRIQLIENTMKNLKPAYEMFIAVPCGEKYYKNKMTEENRFNDGFLFNAGYGRKTFYREYTREEINKFMAEIGFKMNRIFVADKKRLGIYLKES